MIDLHTHSTASDGTYTPAEVAKKAKDMGLYAIALTDHDVVNGVEEFQAELAGSSTMGIAGSELGASYPGVDVEIIAMDIKDLAPYLEREKKLLDIRNDANHQRIELLNKTGINITWEDVSIDEEGKVRELVGKPHLCEAIIKKGYAQTPEQVYKTMLGRGCPAYVLKKDPPMQETIEFIRDTGAVSIMAHPILSGLKGNDLYEYIKTAKDMGLMGIEVFHAKQSKEIQLEYLKIAEDLRLIASGGSDFHGDNHPEMKIGLGVVDENGKGSIDIPDMVLNPILERRQPANNFYKTLYKMML